MHEKQYSVYNLNYKIGSGGFGDVYKATESENKKNYALKLSKNIFINENHSKTLLKELLFGRLLNHPLIMKIEEVLIPNSFRNFNSIWYAYELMDMDLKKFIDSNMLLDISIIQYIMKQLFIGLKYLHDVNVIHRDLKPSNILINEDYSIKISDFGLSCLYDDNIELDQYSGTKQYMSPEMLLGYSYNYEIDIWSVGCIFGELLTGNVLFKSRNTNQIDNIKSFLSFLSIKDTLNIDETFVNLFYNCDSDCIDLLSHLLEWDYKQRYAVEDALNHPFLKDVDININDDNIKREKIDFGFNEDLLSSFEIKQMIINEILYYHPVIQRN